MHAQTRIDIAPLARFYASPHRLSTQSFLRFAFFANYSVHDFPFVGMRKCVYFGMNQTPLVSSFSFARSNKTSHTSHRQVGRIFSAYTQRVISSSREARGKFLLKYTRAAKLDFYSPHFVSFFFSKKKSRKLLRRK
jgi:hypothetical protein